MKKLFKSTLAIVSHGTTWGISTRSNNKTKKRLTAINERASITRHIL